MKSIYKHLVSTIQSEIARQRLDVSVELQDEITFKLAETRFEFEQAFRLVHDSYVSAGVFKPERSRMRILPQHHLDSTSVVIAKIGDEVIGTVTIVRDDQMGLPLERVFDIECLRQSHRQLAEVTCLAVKKEYRRAQGGALFTYLMKYVYEFSLNYFGVHDWVVVVHPRAQLFYQGILGFKPLQKKTVDYLGAPAITFQMDVESIESCYRKKYAWRKASHNLHEFFVLKKVDSFYFPQKKKSEINYSTFSAVRHYFVDHQVPTAEVQDQDFNSKDFTDTSQEAG